MAVKVLLASISDVLNRRSATVLFRNADRAINYPPYIYILPPHILLFVPQELFTIFPSPSSRS